MDVFTPKLFQEIYNKDKNCSLKGIQQKMCCILIFINIINNILKVEFTIVNIEHFLTTKFKINITTYIYIYIIFFIKYTQTHIPIIL